MTKRHFQTMNNNFKMQGASQPPPRTLESYRVLAEGSVGVNIQSVNPSVSY